MPRRFTYFLRSEVATVSADCEAETPEEAVKAVQASITSASICDVDFEQAGVTLYLHHPSWRHSLSDQDTGEEWSTDSMGRWPWDPNDDDQEIWSRRLNLN